MTLDFLKEDSKKRKKTVIVFGVAWKKTISKEKLRVLKD